MGYQLDISQNISWGCGIKLDQSISYKVIVDFRHQQL